MVDNLGMKMLFLSRFRRLINCKAPLILKTVCCIMLYLEWESAFISKKVSIQRNRFCFSGRKRVIPIIRNNGM